MREDGPDRDELLRWVERVATYLAGDGIPPIAGRILGWLMVCDPPEQSAGEIAAAIGASRASLTTNLRVLLMTGMVSRHSRPGQRTTYYRVDDDTWEKVVRRQIAGLVAFGEITRDGLELLGPDSAAASRVRDAQEVFEWLTEVFANAPTPRRRTGPAEE